MSATQAPTNERGGPRQEAAHFSSQEQLESTSATADGKGRLDLRKFTVQEPEDPPQHFDENIIADLHGRLSDYLGKIGVTLTKRGGRLVGKCPQPAHEDSHPSFAVFPNGEMCGCFACGFTGNVFAVSQWLGHSTTFQQAVEDVAGVLGVHLPEHPARTATRGTTATSRPEHKPEPPFTLSDAELGEVHAARLAWCDAFDSGDVIVDRIAESLGLDRETLRHAAWGESGLGLAAGKYGKPTWLCYAYPNGLKWRNPDPDPLANPRFLWNVGKATAPWRMEWALKPEVRTIYLAEGESDCLALIAAGLEDDGTDACVASPGTSFPQTWAAMFTGKRVVLCFDLDTAGQTAAVKVAGMLKGHASQILTWKGPKQ